MKLTVCPDCADAHAQNIVAMFKDLKSPLERMRSEKDPRKSREILESLMHDCVTMGLYLGHGPLNLEIDNGMMHILDVNNNRICK